MGFMSWKPTTNDSSATTKGGEVNNVRAYEADAAELEAAMKLDEAVAGRMAAGADADAVFGELTEGGPNYRAVGWKSTAVLLFKTQIGLGVLSVPSVLHVLGIVPGIICLVALGVMTTWSGWMVGKFKIRHPEVYSVADVGYMLAGPFGREFIAVAYWLYMTCVVGSGLLSSIALNAISLHGTCTAVFVAVSAIAVFLLASIQTLEKLSFIGWAGSISIVAALLTVTVAVAVSDRPAAAPQTGPFDIDIIIFGKPSFAAAMGAIGQLLFAWAGTPAMFGLIAEMRRPQDFTKALIACQTVMVALYLAVAIVVYYYCGQYVASPALGSAGTLIKRIAYGISLPALLASSTIYTHMPAKYLFVRILRGTDDLSRNTPKHYIVWFACTAGCTLFSYVIASAIPVFNGLVGLVGALFGSILCLTLESGMWFFDFAPYWRVDKTLKYRLMFLWALFVGAGGIFITGAGTYGSVVDIKTSYANSKTSPWSCADNSGST